MIDAYIGIGANLGDARGNVRQAMLRLDQLPATRVTATSSLFRSAPLDADGDDYVNAVARIETGLAAPDLLCHLLALERTFGRERPFRNAPRLLDLDILLYGQQLIQSDALTVPHPRLTERAFALLPLLQIDALISIPGKGFAHRFASAVAGQRIERIDD